MIFMRIYTPGAGEGYEREGGRGEGGGPAGGGLNYSQAAGTDNIQNMFFSMNIC